MRNKIDPTQHGFWERFLINIPFILIVLFIIAFVGGSILFFIYGITTYIAFKSPMIILILFGASFISLACGFGLIIAFKKYHIFYEKKMDIFQLEIKSTQTINVKTFKNYLTMANFSYALCIIGTIFCIISALLGSLNRDNWVNAVSPYLESNGYYSDIKTFKVEYEADYDMNHICDYETITIDFKEKTAVIIYNEDSQYKDMVVIESYIQFDKQIEANNNKSDKTIVIYDKETPKLKNNTLNKMLFFIFKDNYFEKQVKIYIPLQYKNSIDINCINGTVIISK